MPSRLSFWTKVPVAISFLPFYIAEQRCEASKPHLRATVRQMWEAYAISAAITLILKISIGHHRPYSNNGPYDFELLDFTLKSSQMSFPSGHTSTAFALMTVLAKRSGSFWVKSAAYILSASVAFQRMQHRKHWASDVLLAVRSATVSGHGWSAAAGITR